MAEHMMHSAPRDKDIYAYAEVSHHGNIAMWTALIGINYVYTYRVAGLDGNWIRVKWDSTKNHWICYNYWGYSGIVHPVKWRD